MTSKEMKFVNASFEKEIMNNVISIIFPILKYDNKLLLLQYLSKLIESISILFLFDPNKQNIYIHQLRQNSFRDTIGLLLLLLPFINDDDGSKKKILTSFDELYIKKVSNTDTDINNAEPKYFYSNIEYGRCNRNKGIATEIPFNESHLQHNYYLLIDTIQIISNKLYINWLDVRPYDMITYADSLLFEKTNETFKDGNLSYWSPNVSNKLPQSYNTSNGLLPGIYVGDIYDTIFNEFYVSIKNIKWLIYDVQIDNAIYPTILILGLLFKNIDHAVNNLSWKQLSDDEREQFEIDWVELVNRLDSGNDITIGNKIIKGIYGRKIVVSIMFFLNKYYSNINLAKKENYVPVKPYNGKNKDNSDDDTEEYNMSGQLGYYMPNIRSLNRYHVYEFIKESLQKIKNTWYGYRLLNIEKTKIIELDNYSLNVTNLNIKNIYNYAKSVCINYVEKDGKLVEYPGFWRTLNDKQKDIILNRLNNKISNVMSWFNISNYIRLIYNLSGKDITDKNIEIYNNVRNNLMKFVFESLILKGVLSMFIPDSDITDGKDFSSPQDRITISDKLKQKILNKNNPVWNHSYYYLTGTTYAGMKEMENVEIYTGQINDNREQIKKKVTVNYFDFLTNGISDWNLQYAMNWIAQIGFFHRFINNRVIYVTGATGVGKSTQIPKLLLYALKMIDNKKYGKIACTQPRRKPTEDNAERIALELGTPIYKEKKRYTSKQNNYYVQFKHQEDQHIEERGNGISNHLVLKLVTDGTLLLELSNPLEKLVQYRQTAELNQTMTYLTENIYDIVIVDEAHEHNANMDLILTFMQNCTYYNNNIRLVIISATMQADEPTYRRYYRDINDNKIFPFNNYVEKHNFDRVNVDRRFHISAPGQTTKYRITEFYRPNSNVREIVNEILKSSDIGDILIFQPGQKEIMDTVNDLNANTPGNVIALPFYSELKERNKKLVGDIAKTKSEIKISKDMVANFNEIDDFSQGTNIYNRAIVVATNIAEASITISTLKYVIETGEQKTAVYNYQKGAENLQLGSISEASRLQRKGRVGRTSSGTVYYLYEKDAMAKNKIQYTIAIIDISNQLYEKLHKSAHEKILFNADNDPNKLNKDIKVSDLHKLYPKDVAVIIKNQYFNDGKYMSYVGGIDQYDYNNAIAPEPWYETGFSKNTLEDATGKFYIVHPEELNIIRNILGKIVGILSGADIDLKNNKITSYKIKSFWQILIDRLFIYPDEDDYSKTLYGYNLAQLNEELEIENIKLVIAYVYSRKYKCEENMIRLVCMYASMKLKLSSLIAGIVVNGRFRQQFSEVSLMFGNSSKSDSETIINIIDQLHKFINKDNNILDVANIDTINEMTKYKKDVSESFYSELIQEEISKGNLKNSITMDIDDIKNIYINNINVKWILNKLNSEYKGKIEKWCNDHYLNYKTISHYLKNYVQFKNTLFKIINKIQKYDSNKKNIVDLNIFDKLLNVKPLSNMNDNITLSLLQGFSYNVVKKFEGSNPFYLSIHNPSSTNIYQIDYIKARIPVLRTTVSKIYLTNYILYLSSNVEDDTISLLHYINLEMLSHVSYIYNLKFVNSFKKIGEKQINTSYIIKKLPNVGISIINNYNRTLEKIELDLTNAYNPNIWLNFNSFDKGLTKALQYERDSNVIQEGGYIGDIGPIKLISYMLIDK